MTRDEFNAFCATLPATSHVVQWGNSDVWKVGDKVFAVCGWHEEAPAFTFKVGDIAWEDGGAGRSATVRGRALGVGSFGGGRGRARGGG